MDKPKSICKIGDAKGKNHRNTKDPCDHLARHHLERDELSGYPKQDGLKDSSSGKKINRLETVGT